MDASLLANHSKSYRDCTRPWMFLVSAPSPISELPQKLGLADYSYGFVVKSLAPVLERLGQWRQVSAPESSLIYAATQAIAQGFRPVHVAVVPVHSAYLTPAVPTILFPFWEFPRIPDRDFGFETRQNWARVAKRASAIVTACEMTAQSFRQAGVTCPVEVVPVPIPASAANIPTWTRDQSVFINCRHISWGGPPLPHDDTGSRSATSTYLPIGWRAHVKAQYRRHVKSLLPTKAQQWVARSKRATINALSRRKQPPPPPYIRVNQTWLHLSGLVYTTIFNLLDQRKNPHDLITAFLLAFKDRPDATLVLKLATTPETEFAHLETLRQMCVAHGVDHKCRMVIIAGYLSDEELADLFRATTFYVNTSRAEGACLPLQQALACGRPGIAPSHTAMADYMDERVGFVISSHHEPTHWPHDPQRRIKTSWHRLVWPSLYEQYKRSAELATEDIAAYNAMAEVARARMHSYAGLDAVTHSFRRVVEQLAGAPYGALDWPGGRVA